MKKAFILCAMILYMSFCMGNAVSAGVLVHTKSFTEKTVKVMSDSGEAGELTLRFYKETPHIPYLGIGAYSEFMKDQALTLSENEDGTFTLKNSIDEEAFYDPVANALVIPDWNRFFDLPLPLENEAMGWKDTATRFIRITDVEFEGEPETVTLDFAKYGIRTYADENDIYLPVSTLSNIMTDIAINYMTYNGEYLYKQRLSLEGSVPDGFYDSEQIKAVFQGQKRPEDIRKQCYADLCFNFDYFFGHPGVAVLDEAIAEKGLDQALTDLGEEGTSLKDGLLSSDFMKYVSAMFEVFARYLGDGHTSFLPNAILLEHLSDGSFDSLIQNLDMVQSMINSPSYMNQIISLFVEPQRSAAWGRDTYRESGNTAIIRLDSFMPDEEAWDLYYKGEGDFPEDSLGIVISGLRRASENPEIENVIFDLSCNSGGSPDVMMSILAVTTGQNQLYGVHKLTNRKFTMTFEADTNFDGVYDEKDQEVNYDYNYGVLVTRHAFSCGNLFPIIIQEAGAALIGEPSSGGSCCIQVGTDAECLNYIISSGQWQLTDSDSVSVEGGCKIDLPIEAKSGGILNAIVGFMGINGEFPSYDKYFDDVFLAELMNAYFASPSEENLAA